MGGRPFADASLLDRQCRTMISEREKWSKPGDHQRFLPGALFVHIVAELRGDRLEFSEAEETRICETKY